MVFSWLDYLCGGIVAISVIVSFFRGFAKEMISLVAWIVGAMLAFTYAPTAQAWFSSWISVETVRFVVAFIVILLVVLLIGCLINKLISFCVKHIGLSFFDRLVGVLFGVVRGVFLVVVISIFVDSLHWQDKPWAQRSVVLHKTKPVAVWVGEMLPEEVSSVHGWLNAQDQNEDKQDNKS